MRDKSPEPWMPFFRLIDYRIKTFSMLIFEYGMTFLIAYYGFPPITTNEGFSLSANSILVALFCFLITYILAITIYQIKELNSFVAKPEDYPYSSERFKLLTGIEASVFFFLVFFPIFSADIIFKNLYESLLILMLLSSYLIISGFLNEKIVKENNIRKKILSKRGVEIVEK